MVAIHDKSREGRRKLKEGPKAQETYVEGLHNEWHGNHTLNQKRPKEDCRAHQVPGHIREAADRAEMETREKLNREHQRDTIKTKAFITRESGLIVPGGYGY